MAKYLLFWKFLCFLFLFKTSLTVSVNISRKVQICKMEESPNLFQRDEVIKDILRTIIEEAPVNSERDRGATEDEIMLKKFRDSYLGLEGESSRAYLNPINISFVKQIQFLLKQESLAPIEIVKVKNLHSLIEESKTSGLDLVGTPKNRERKGPRKCGSSKFKNEHCHRILRSKASSTICKPKEIKFSGKFRKVNVRIPNLKVSPNTMKRSFSNYWSPIKSASLKRARYVQMSSPVDEVIQSPLAVKVKSPRSQEYRKNLLTKFEENPPKYSSVDVIIETEALKSGMEIKTDTEALTEPASNVYMKSAARMELGLDNIIETEATTKPVEDGNIENVALMEPGVKARADSDGREWSGQADSSEPDAIVNEIQLGIEPEAAVDVLQGEESPEGNAYLAPASFQEFPQVCLWYLMINIPIKNSQIT